MAFVNSNYRISDPLGRSLKVSPIFPCAVLHPSHLKSFLIRPTTDCTIALAPSPYHHALPVPSSSSTVWESGVHCAAYMEI